MAHLFKNPAWVDPRLLTKAEIENVPLSLFKEINSGLSNFQSENPLVSVVIPVFNEEYTILRTLHSLSRNKTTYPVEIIVVNNNSTDRTQGVLDKLAVKSYFQPVPGWGPARQLGQEKALGKYILSADADSFYPEEWIQRLTTALMKEDVACVYGDYSFLGSSENPRWEFSIYEFMRDIIRSIRHFKRPQLNARGLNMGFPRELGLKKGYVYRKIRGEDGRMCFDLMRFGKIVRLRSLKTRVWTPARTLKSDGGLLFNLLSHGVTEMQRLRKYLRPSPPHDTHTSLNSEPSKLNKVKAKILRKQDLV